jgi:hypothetical protein
MKRNRSKKRLYASSLRLDSAEWKGLGEKIVSVTVSTANTWSFTGGSAMLVAMRSDSISGSLQSSRVGLI